MSSFLKKLRQKHGVSQEFLARQIGVSRPTFMQIENESRKIFVEEAQKLAQFFNLSLEDFLAERENKNPKVEFKKSEKAKQKEPKVRISVPQENLVKFKEVLLYILEKIGALHNIGEAVICKLLYFIDFDYYEKYEEQLIGAVYIKNHHGPTPAAFNEIIKKMEKDGDIIQVVKKYFQYDQRKYLPLRNANLSVFSAREKSLIDSEIERFKNKNAKEMKEISHRDVPWIGAKNLQPIDYEAVFCRTPEFSVRKYNNEL